MASTLLLVIVFVLNLIAFALAVAAEQRRSTATIVSNEGTQSYCKYDSDVSTGLGIGAFVLLLASQLLIMLTSRCLCCGRGLRPGGSRTWAIVLFISSWVLFFIAEVCLLAGSVQNAYHTRYRSIVNHPPSCQTLRKGVFAAGAAFTVFTGIISELYYVSYSKASVDIAPNRGGDTGLRMGNL
ncbi:hypothetical protein SOVF_149890 [Spinacia oleracea]|uniref:Fiber protein Fb34 n=1 Tax=Spinacia oleracea TaxID=3562 RepID=A0A9R0K3M8_SPIOL|nr:uncharacterized protein LOC110779344 [Spinacia oleracea]KNA09835.1 hypothetical protein SOVF_149890 [Spinacia oleracea]